jgi:fructan beta-fructosidase
MKYKLSTLVLIAVICYSCNYQISNRIIEPGYYQEKYRPQYHFTPEKMWTNDPNGLVFYDGEYHLFYQYYPDSAVWGPMHWGHAVSTDLLHWQHLPVALYPDSLGYIFSGSAVMDTSNTSGLGKPGKPAMVAIFTYHNPVIEKKGFNNYQYQGLAYSTDKGRTWTKYQGNPVLPNPGMRDFRDPNVSWNNAAGRWIMTLAAGDHICFYSSCNLKEWKFESEFGKDKGAHGGVWECPDLFEIPVANEPGTKKWVLLVSINPGGPFGGSATQYFTGLFDDHKFISDDTPLRWIDYGPDNYAGVLWSNTGNRKIFLGWMNNWSYASKVPTSPWRGQMTIPREISLIQMDGKYMVSSTPVPEFGKLLKLLTEKENIPGQKGFQVRFVKDELNTSKTDLDLSASDSSEIVIEVSNDSGRKLIFGYDRKNGDLYCDRTLGGINSFNNSFAGTVHKISIPVLKGNISLSLILDRCSAELFFDGGIYNLTELVFPENGFNILKIYFKQGDGIITKLKISSIKSVWRSE